MAIGINIPKKPQGTSSLLQLAGMGAGALVGGPAGAAVGGTIGGAVGSLNKQESVQPVEANALSRRQVAMEDNPQMQIGKSIAALEQIPDVEQRALLAEPLLRAQKIAREYGA